LEVEAVPVEFPVCTVLEFADCSVAGVTDASRDAGSESVAARDAVMAACCPRYVMEFPGPEEMLMVTGDDRGGADDPAAGRGVTYSEDALEDGAGDATGDGVDTVEDARALCGSAGDEIEAFATVYELASAVENRAAWGETGSRDSTGTASVSESSAFFF
jgi:hypothetical protein